MDSRQLVLDAFSFRTPARIPRFDSFWHFPPEWRQRLGPAEDLTDIRIWAPDETPFPTRAGKIREEDGWTYEVTGWGQTVRRRPGASFTEILSAAIPPGVDPDSVPFDPPLLESRFGRGKNLQDEECALIGDKSRYAVFVKTGGPYLRTAFLRGEEAFLFDMAADPPLAQALAAKVADHITAVGVHALKRWNLQETGMWIYDDMASNNGPLFSPRSFERILLPSYRRMIAAYRAAGASHIMLHSDGCINPIVDMLVDAGIDGIHPLERRAGMDPAALRKRHPKLILVGGMDNTGTLIHGPISAVQAQTRELIELGRNGGLVIGAHSIGPDIPLEHVAAYLDTCHKHGVFA